MDVTAPLLRAPTERPSLEGDLNDLRPIELLRLLGQTTQTGTLQVLADGPALLTIVDGAVSYATTDPARTLRHVLTDAGLVDDARWQQAAAQDAVDFGDALVAAGVDEDGLVACVRTAVLDVLTDLSLAPRGRFRFVTGRRHALGARFHYSPDDIDRDLAARLEKWERIAAVVPDLSRGARLTRTLPAGRTGVTIRAADWRVLVAVEAARTLGDARKTLGTTRYALSSCVADLVEMGVLELTDSPA